MLNVSNAWHDAITSISRHLTFHILLADSSELSTQNILSIKITRAGASQQKLLPGEFCKAQCKMQTTQQVLGSFRITCTADGAEDVISLGTYWVNTCEYDEGSKRYSVTAYDVPPWMDSVCRSGNRAVADLLSEIETSTGMTITNKNLLTLTTIENMEEDITWLELLKELAGYDGYSVRTNDGNLELYKYTDVDYTVPTSLIYSTGLKKNQSDTTINYYLVNETYTVGSGAYGISYRNPYIDTQEQTEAMASYLNLTYTPMYLKFVGDPALQIGDIITVKDLQGNDHTCLVMDMTITIDGGFAMEVNCYSDENVKSVISERPSDRKLRELKQYTQSSLERIMDSIFSEGDGYYFTIDANGDPVTGPGQTPAGFQITDASMTQGWRFILGGLYHSNDGFQSVNNLAISADGQIYGQFLAANSVETTALNVTAQDVVNGTERYITFGNGIMTIGEKDANGNIVSDYHAQYTSAGMRVANQNEAITLKAEGDTVDAVNLTSHQFLKITDDAQPVTARFQGFNNTVQNVFQYAIFMERKDNEVS